VATIDDPFFSHVVRVEEGSRLRLMCSVSKGDPPLRFRWTKNGLGISSHGERVIETTDDSSIIKIARVVFADHGEYTCFVPNDAASVNRSLELVVHGESVMPWKLPSKLLVPYDNFRSHQFNNGSLLIREVQEADGSFYLCEADNGVGTGMSRLAHLKVKAPPTSPSIKTLPLSNSSLLVQWEREKDDYSATAGCPVTSFAVQYRPRFHKAWILATDAVRHGKRPYVIGDRAPDRQHQVRVVAHSDTGDTQADFPFRTATLPARDDVSLRILVEIS
ncbi:hypothetical protein MTO96_041392, partial [Rhipicephalus appendiculatus]